MSDEMCVRFHQVSFTPQKVQFPMEAKKKKPENEDGEWKCERHIACGW